LTMYPELRRVVDLSVEQHNVSAIFAAHWLFSCLGQVDDREPCERQIRDCAPGFVALGMLRIRSAMAECLQHIDVKVRHCLQANVSGDSTHVPSSLIGK